MSSVTDLSEGGGASPGRNYKSFYAHFERSRGAQNGETERHCPSWILEGRSRGRGYIDGVSELRRAQQPATAGRPAHVSAHGGASARRKPARRRRLQWKLLRPPAPTTWVDVIKSLGIDYFAANPASTLKSLHESIINYGGNTAPGSY